LSCQSKSLPDWGMQEFQASGITDRTDDNNIWTVETHINRLRAYPLLPHTHCPHLLTPLIFVITAVSQFIEYAPPAGFWEKFFEIHQKMYLQNAYLLQPHKYSSSPASWPFLLKGTLFWEGQKNQQIFLLGNYFVWVLACYCGVFAFVVIYLATFLREHRGHFDFGLEARGRFRYSGLLLFGGWLLNYLPYFFMDRTLYLHHYFPSLIFSILLTGVVFGESTKCVFWGKILSNFALNH